MGHACFSIMTNSAKKKSASQMRTIESSETLRELTDSRAKLAQLFPILAGYLSMVRTSFWFIPSTAT